MDLQADQETLRLYPFLFHLRITYPLVGATLRTTYTVKNTGESDLLFSIGAHPGFNCPLLRGERLDDYYLEFEQEELRRTLLQDGLLSNRTETLVLQGRRIPLHHSLFDADALVFANNQINTIWLRSKNHQRALRMDCAGWPWFGIWSKKGAHPFICLEPWMGITDKEENSGKLSEKAGIICLAPTHNHACDFQLSIF
jgi:galactose mutarotase-like enzyme